MSRTRSIVGVALCVWACSGSGASPTSISPASPSTLHLTGSRSPTAPSTSTSTTSNSTPDDSSNGSNPQLTSSAPPQAPAPQGSEQTVVECAPGDLSCAQDGVISRPVVRDMEFRGEREEQRRIIEANPDVGYFREFQQPLRYVPDKVSIDQLVRRLPCKESRDDFRNALRGEGQSFQISTEWLDATPNDGEPQWQLIWARTILCNVVFLFDASGALRDTLAFESRGGFSLGEVVVREDEVEVPELLFEEVVGTSVCCYPVVNHVIRITPRGKFKKVFKHQRSYDHVGPGVRYDYWFQFEYQENQINVRKLFPSAENRPVERYTYQRHLDRFAPSAETRRLLQDDAKRERE